VCADTVSCDIRTILISLLIPFPLGKSGFYNKSISLIFTTENALITYDAYSSCISVCSCHRPDAGCRLYLIHEHLRYPSAGNSNPGPNTGTIGSCCGGYEPAGRCSHAGTRHLQCRYNQRPRHVWRVRVCLPVQCPLSAGPVLLQRWFHSGEQPVRCRTWRYNHRDRLP
jgi:hypothetical protein